MQKNFFEIKSLRNYVEKQRIPQYFQKLPYYCYLAELRHLLFSLRLLLDFFQHSHTKPLRILSQHDRLWVVLVAKMKRNRFFNFIERLRK